MAAPLFELRTPWQRYLDAMYRYVEAGEDDREFHRAESNLKHAMRTWALREGLGRPPSVDTVEVARLWREVQSVRGVARALGATRQSVYRALRRAGVRK